MRRSLGQPKKRKQFDMPLLRAPREAAAPLLPLPPRQLLPLGFKPRPASCHKQKRIHQARRKQADMDSSNKAVRERKQFLNAAINKAAPAVRRANVLHHWLADISQPSFWSCCTTCRTARHKSTCKYEAQAENAFTSQRYHLRQSIARSQRTTKTFARKTRPSVACSECTSQG